jgi:hypothetical protein
MTGGWRGQTIVHVHRLGLHMSTTKHSCSRLFVITVVAGAVALTGCSTPYALRWDGGAPAAGASMPTAMAELHALRKEYRTAISAHLNDERTLSNVLVGAGALVLALALGSAHSDAIAGTALAAGTVYTLGSSNLPRPRLLVYQAGVEALNCVERAAAPLVTSDDASGVQAGVDALRAARAGVTDAILRGREARVAAPLVAGAPTLDALDFDTAVVNGNTALQGSDATLAAGLAWLAASRRAARQLLAAVNGVHDAVQRSLIAATPDLSAVPGLVSGLAGTAASFAPGAGLDTVAATKMENAVKFKAQSAPVDPTPLQSATVAVRAATLDLVQAQRSLAAMLEGHTTVWPADAFKDCGVAQVIATLSVDPASASFTVGSDGRRTLDISGGVKPYFVEFDGDVIEGLSLRAPIRFDSRIELQASGDKLKKPGDSALRVVDSSPGGKAVRVPISVAVAGPAPASAPAAAPAKAPTPPPGGAAGTSSAIPQPKPSAPAPQPATGTIPAAPAPAPATAAGGVGSAALNMALEALKRKDSFVMAGKTFTRTGIPTRQGDMLVTDVRCPVGVTTTRAAIASAYLSEAGAPLAVAPQLQVRTDPATCAPS